MAQQTPSTSATHDGRLWGKDPTTGEYVPVVLTVDGKLPVEASVSGAAGDTVLVDGVSAAIKATVKNYSNSKPLAVINVDTNGDPTGGAAVSVADGANVVEGAVADVKVVGDNSGTLSAKLRGLNYLLALVVDIGNTWLKVSIQNATLAVTQSGSWLVGGDTAAAATDAGNPIKLGGKAASAAPTAVTAGQRANGLFDLWGRLLVRTGMQAPVASTFTQVHVPATNTQATKSQASAGSGKRNVCTGFTFTLCAGASAPTPGTPVVVSIIDGASGGTTYLWRSNITMPAVAGGVVAFIRSGLWLVGSQATALTAEFSAAGGANTYESVSFDGVVVEE